MIEFDFKQNCCGCEACLQTCPTEAISLKNDAEGFWYPLVNKEKCVRCGLCRCVCPSLNPQNANEPIKAFASKNSNNIVRRNSSSGGVFYALAKFVLEQKGVVFGAKFNREWLLEHDSVEGLEELFPLLGSKYIQSKIGRSFIKVKSLLENGRMVLFVGAPCQVVALKLFLNKEYSNLILVDFVCHGVPSPKFWKFYLDATIKKKFFSRVSKTKDVIKCFEAVVKRISFRDKRFGWRMNRLKLNFATKDSFRKSIGFFAQFNEKNLFMKAYLGNYIQRPSCYVCPTKPYKGSSDITLADFWGIHRYLPQFADDNGVSLVLVNTIKGLATFEHLNLYSLSVDFEKAKEFNKMIFESVKCPENRDEFLVNSYNQPILKFLEFFFYDPFLKRAFFVLKFAIFYLKKRLAAISK